MLSGLLKRRAPMSTAGTLGTPGFFRGKAADYARYRVDYPDVVIQSALESVALVPDDIVADLGAGTGMLSRWFLERGNRVLAVEPEPGMREVAQASLTRFGAQHTSIAGTAERTSLIDSSVTLVVAGNAFHYFDAEAARVEVARILRPGGRVLIVGHAHALEPNDFMRAYADFIAPLTSDEMRPFHQAERVSRAAQTFFQGNTFHECDMGDHTFPLTWNGLRGRFLSTSVAPAEGDVRREGVVAQLSDLFGRFAQNAAVPFQLRWRYVWSERWWPSRTTS
jgi:ubiquinone/menaquinone biosynthesis C-methylase UbiE